jgi:hypothetical protein
MIQGDPVEPAIQRTCRMARASLASPPDLQLLLEDNFFHIKISQIDLRGGQKPIVTL